MIECRKCFQPLEFKCEVKGADSVIELICSRCEEHLFKVNTEIEQLRDGKLYYFQNTMKHVYAAMFEGMSFAAVQRYCAIFDMPDISKRQFLKYKAVITKVAKKQSKKAS